MELFKETKSMMFYQPGKPIKLPVKSLLAGFLLMASTVTWADVVTCGLSGPDTLVAQTEGNDLEVTGNVCTVKAGVYNFHNVNIFNGGTLAFEDAVIDFWAESILVENEGSLTAGSTAAPIGTKGGVLTIHLYGADQLVPPLSDYQIGAAVKKGNAGIVCKTAGKLCGVPAAIWNSNVGIPVGDGNYPDSVKSDLPGDVRDYFYAYTPLPFDDGETNGEIGYFGRKVLAVSYGGSLQLFGKKGASYAESSACDVADPAQSCTSWGRLGVVIPRGKQSTGSETQIGLNPHDTQLKIDRLVDWEVNDQIVVTTTDYLPGHSEEFTITGIDGQNIQFNSTEPDGGARYLHDGHRHDLSAIPERLGITRKNAETRAAVALLTRSIRIVSEGDGFAPGAQDNFPPERGNFFGGHTVIRQGIKTYQVQGVEFKRLGQGGRMGHYPIHFHTVRKAPANTFVKDSSINESMTRWITLHATQGVLLARNVGYKSIGHGYFQEDGTEIDNRLYSNLGIFARAAVDNIQNPRKVPGIFSQQQQDAAGTLSFDTSGTLTRVQSDVANPSVFWITNTWNDYQYNMAAGAGTCGACYWPIPAVIGGSSVNQRWDSYASLQRNISNVGTSPFQRFEGNYCSTAMNSLNTSGDTSSCHGLSLESTDSNPALVPIANPLIPLPAKPPQAPTPWFQSTYFPRVSSGTFKTGTRCDAHSPGARVTTDSSGEVEVDCTFVPPCSNQGDGVSDHCMVNIIDRYTSSFHWAETNFGAIWLRGSQWYLVLNSVVTDVQNGGLSMVTGGDYTGSSAINGHWALVRKSVFIGSTDPDNPYSSNGGPFVPGGLECEGNAGNNCLSVDEGINIQLSNFGMNQRLFNIYDGPTFQDSNAYMDIYTRPIDDCQLNTAAGYSQSCFNSSSMYGRVLGLPADEDGQCYMPNAAIGWKQPNGFYYPPAFHSFNLYFDEVDIRHFVLEPLFTPGTLDQDNDLVSMRYCTRSPDMFSASFTDVDRQTVLNDDDGSLTGLAETISVNEDPFFNAPVEAKECRSGSPASAKTSPYDYVTTVMYPECAITTGQKDPAAEKCSAPAQWSRPCSNSNCYGVPLYRQFLTEAESKIKPLPDPHIRMMGSSLYQRSNLTVNHGKFYIDTTISAEKQNKEHINTFTAGETYYLFLLFAKADTDQTYQLYVGKNAGDSFLADNVNMTRVNPKGVPFSFEKESWPTQWERSYDPASGILSVRLKLSDIQPEIDQAKETQCLPSSVCKYENKQCVTSLQPNDYLYQEFVDGKICENALLAVDCPAGGCYGFSVTMPDTFSTDLPVDPRPASELFSADPNFNWNVDWQFGSADIAGDCGNPPTEF
jgi:hypothetical protein